MARKVPGARDSGGHALQDIDSIDELSGMEAPRPTPVSENDFELHFQLR